MATDMCARCPRASSRPCQRCGAPGPAFADSSHSDTAWLWPLMGGNVNGPGSRDLEIDSPSHWQFTSPHSHRRNLTERLAQADMARALWHGGPSPRTLHVPANTSPLGWVCRLVCGRQAKELESALQASLLELRAASQSDPETLYSVPGVVSSRGRCTPVPRSTPDAQPFLHRRTAFARRSTPRSLLARLLPPADPNARG